MPRFFTYFHAPIFWGFIALSLWSIVLAFVPRLSSGLVAVGFGAIIAVIVATSVRHYSTPRVTRKEFIGHPDAIPLGQIAAKRGFYIGTVGFSHNLKGLDSVLGTHFNSVTPEYEIKWSELLVNKTIGQYDFSFADRLVDHALSRGVRVRGHTLLWGKFALPVNLARIVESSGNPTGTLKEILFHHITTVMEHFRDRISEWDVVNEPLDCRSPRLDLSIFVRYLGEEYIDFAFASARAADPKSRLFLNEQLWSYTNSQSRFFLQLLGRLKARAVPMDGVGIQSHVNIPPIPTAHDFGLYLRRIAALGYDIEITEFDAILRLFCSQPNPYQAQGDYFRDMLAACLEVPRCRGLTVWGLSDGDTWYKKAAHFRHFGPHEPHLFDAKMQPKQSYWGVYSALSAQAGPQSRMK